MLCIILQSMAKDKTATIVFKGEDQISPAIKAATASVAGLNQSFAGVENASNKTAVQIKAELTKAIAVVNNELANLSKQKLTPDVEIKINDALQQLGKLKSQLKEIDKVVVTPEIKTSGLKNAIDEIKTGISREIGAQITQGLAQIPSAIASTTLQFEKLQTTLKSTLGSQSAADEAFARIKAFAAETPFQVSEITESFIKLQNRGIAPTTPLLRQLGDIASSQGKSLNQITEAILDASTGEFERLKEFGIQASKSGDQVTIAFKGVEKTIANTPQAINAAVASLGDLQGVSGGMEAQSKTLGGALSNLQDTADTLAVAFGQELTPILLEIVKSFSASAGGGENLARSLGQNVGNAIRFLVENGDKLKIILELIVIQFGLVKLQAAAAAISTAASGAAALTAAGGFVALAGAIGTATLAIAPLALAFATIKGIEFAKFANDLKAFNEELEIASVGSTQLANDTSKIISKLQALQEVRKKGGALTAEQKKQEAGFLQLSEKNLEAEKRALAQIEALKAPTPELETARQVDINTRKQTISLLEKERKELETLQKTSAKSGEVAKRTEKQREEAVKDRIALEKRAADDSARLRSRNFEAGAKAESGNFEAQARANQQAFEKSLNAERKSFEDAQKADKERFEKGLLAEQRTFNDDEKSKDATYQKSKQDAERAFNAEQQAQKAAFDKQQQDASRAFDAQQNKEKLAAESQFSQRRLEIERQLQLDAAKTPEDRAKLEAEFKIADEKAAREKAAFAQLKADEEAFALKQQQAKIAFEESQKLAAQTFEANQQAAKLAFDDALKLKDQEYEKQKEAAKLAFEDTLKAKRETLELEQNNAKLAFEEQLAAKKQVFDDLERAKKDAFETTQNEKKAAFEESERVKKQAFEDNLKALEAKFKADERAKDLANAQQVAAIKNATPASAIASKVPALAGIGVKPLATGGRFNAGEQLLVGERGKELVTFGNSGFVSKASDTKQILQSNSPASTMSTAKIEGLLTQLVGKLDRPNIAVTTAENPSDTLIKIQREIGRSLAVGL
jgi:hypothetical protein